MIPDRYFFQISAQKLKIELIECHTLVVKAIHDQSEPDPRLERSHGYRSIVGLSPPKFGQLTDYITEKYLSDYELRLRFAKKHPAEYIGDVLHCVSTDRGALASLCLNNNIQQLQEVGVELSDIILVPETCSEIRLARDRRPDKRTPKNQLEKQKYFNLGGTYQCLKIEPVNEPLPALNVISSGRHNTKNRHGVNLRMESDCIPKGGWFSVYGLSTQGSTVPLIPVYKNT